MAVSGLLLGGGGQDNLLYLNASTPVDQSGLMWDMGAAVQLPGVSPLDVSTLVEVYNASGMVVEGNGGGVEGLVDGLAQAFLSNVPGFLNHTIAASNINSLAASYATCQAPSLSPMAASTHSAQRLQWRYPFHLLLRRE